jgi:hypothetical protein
MKKELFTTHVKSNGVKILSKNDINFNIHILSSFHNLKGFIKNIDFDCQINPKGGCRVTPNSIRCCCSNCYHNAGFFRVMIDTDIIKYSKQFSIRTGFWRKGKGCILPHKMRSVTCLTHHCNHDHIEYFGYGIMTIRHKLHDLRRRILNARFKGGISP